MASLLDLLLFPLLQLMYVSTSNSKSHTMIMYIIVKENTFTCFCILTFSFKDSPLGSAMVCLSSALKILLGRILVNHFLIYFVLLIICV